MLSLVLRGFDEGYSSWYSHCFASRELKRVGVLAACQPWQASIDTGCLGTKIVCVKFSYVTTHHTTLCMEHNGCVGSVLQS